MLGIAYNDGRKDHPDQEKVIGSYDWRKFTVFARIPHSAKSVDLCIGLQGCAGKISIDNLKVVLLPAPVIPKDGHCKQQLPVQKETKFRGVMSGGDLSPAAFRELNEVWNANLIRFQLSRRRNEDHTTEEGFRKIIARGLSELDAILPPPGRTGSKS